MKWIKIPEGENVRLYLPKDRQFLCLFKGAICLGDYDDDSDSFYLANQPSVYQACWKIDSEREGKIEYWCELQLPEDY